MNTQFLETARAEFAETVNYYNSQAEGLGFDFSDEVHATIERIIEHPEAWAPVSKRVATGRITVFSGVTGITAI